MSNAGPMSAECFGNLLRLTLSAEYFEDKYLFFSVVGKLIQKNLKRDLHMMKCLKFSEILLYWNSLAYSKTIEFSRFVLIAK